MAIAVFGDIHGNLEALEAILKDIKKNRKIKQVYYLGDAITFGPDSSACLKLLEKNKVNFIVGNHEQRVVRYDKAVDVMTYASEKHMEWVFSQLDSDNLRYIRGGVVDIKANYKGFNLLFTHYSHDADGVLRDDYDEFKESALERLFGKTTTDVVFFGHIHNRKIIINEQGKSFICNGSSGCVHTDRTFYTYFEVNERMHRNFDIYRVNVKFNRKKFEEKMIKLDIPEKEKFAKFCFGMEVGQGGKG